jgi:F-type H+-transporting ATPase subunit gamma
MANLKELRTRIASVKTTMQVTSAMKMVSAAKLRKAQNAITQLRPFADNIFQMLVSLLSENTDFENPLMENRKIENVLLIPISSNRGLCGAFNTNVEKMTFQAIADYKVQNINAHIFTIGKKIYESSTKKKYSVSNFDIEIFDKVNYDYCQTLSQQVLNDFLTKKFDKVEFIYHKFKSAGSFNLVKEQYLPLIFPISEKSKVSIDYILEPNYNELIEKLLPTALTIKFNQVVFDSIASEHGARMTAMHQATENAKDLISDLTLNYNKARQAAITKEIIEIVSGAEALKG